MKKIFLIAMSIIILSQPLLLSSCGKDCIMCDNGEDIDYYDILSTTATCMRNGVGTVKCKYCSRTAEIEIKAFGHDFVVTKDEVTCSQDGNTYYTCQRENCGETKTVWSKANSSKHKWVQTYSTESIQYRYADYKCSICQETKTEKTSIYLGTSIESTDEYFWYATAAAIRIVKEQLKYPSNARFIKESQMEVRHNSATGYYYIEGAVSAPNAFGVYSNFYFIVKTKISVSGGKFTWYDYDCELEEG